MARRRRGRLPVGFTIMSLLVVIAVILILVSLVVGAAMKANENARRNHTRTIIQAVKTLEIEYKVQTQQVINHGGTAPFDWSEDRDMNAPGSSGSAPIDDPGLSDEDRVLEFSIERFVWVVNNHPGTREHVLSTVGRDQLQDLDGDGFLEMRDAFGNKLVYVEGVSHNDFLVGDDFLPEHPRPYVASAGPDGDFGDARADPADPDPIVQALVEARQDNLYSFEDN